MNPIETAFQSIYGLPCWDVQWDVHLTLSMNFGQPSLRIREPRQSTSTSEQVRHLFAYRHVTVRGEWLLWIEQAYWKLSLRDFEPVTGSHSYRRMRMALARLDGQQLLQATMDPRNGATTFRFDLGGVLSVRRLEPDPPCRLWSLYTPVNTVLIIRGDGRYSFGPKDEPEQLEPLRSIQQS